MRRVLAVLILVCLCQFDDNPVTAQESIGKLRISSAVRRDLLRDRANENVLYLMGGALGATYIIMAHDMSVVVNKAGTVRVIPAVGGAAVQNVRDVLLLRGVDLGIASVQSLRALQASGEHGMSDVSSRLAYIAVLSVDQMQVLARPEINSLKDLAGKTVAFNTQGSSTALLAPKVFSTLGVEVKSVFMPQGDAIEQMRSGAIAATVCMCPIPTPAYAAAKSDTGFKFVSVDYSETLERDYLPANFDADDYPQLVAPGTQIKTIATQSILLTYNWPREHWRYARVAKFVDALFSNFAELQKPPRHVLWKSANLAASVNGFQRFPAAQEWLDRHKGR